jgi:peptidoglycan/LPS O-acetylase OafA/YrhL
MLIPVGVGRADYRLGVEWTLVFEIFFYAALGVMLLFSQKRGPMIGAALWLAVIIGGVWLKMPADYNPLPNWTEIAFSPLAAPFLMGALAAPLMRFAPQIRMASPVLVPAIFAASKLVGRWDVGALVVGIGAALTVLWAAAARQLSAENPLVIYGDWSYGVYLLHVPVITTIIDASLFRNWAYPTFELVGVAGFAAIVVGLSYGRCEAAVYKRVRNWLRSRAGTAKPRLVIHVPGATAKAA